MCSVKTEDNFNVDQNVLEWSLNHCKYCTTYCCYLLHYILLIYARQDIFKEYCRGISAGVTATFNLGPTRIVFWKVDRAIDSCNQLYMIMRLHQFAAALRKNDQLWGRPAKSDLEMECIPGKQVAAMQGVLKTFKKDNAYGLLTKCCPHHDLFSKTAECKPEGFLDPTFLESWWRRPMQLCPISSYRCSVVGGPRAVLVGYMGRVWMLACYIRTSPGS